MLTLVVIVCLAVIRNPLQQFERLKVEIVLKVVSTVRNLSKHSSCKPCRVFNARESVEILIKAMPLANRLIRLN